jgi:homoserine kinase type II
MAVYTEVSLDDASALLQRAVGSTATGIEPLPGGIENSNYRVTTADTDLVLTVIERQDPARLAGPLDWMDQLNCAGLPVPRTLAGPVARLEHRGKSVILTSWCRGGQVACVTPAQAGSVGALLGEIHHQSPPAPLPEDPHDRGWLEERVALARDLLAGEDREIAIGGWHLYQALDLAALPAGAIHADVFLDNLLFDGDTVSGLVDFHYACDGPYLYDLAIAANDLCSRADGSNVAELEAALLWGYQGVRRLSGVEDEAWRAMRAIAAFRFWMSRLWDREHIRPGPMPQIKDPDQFRHRTRDCFSRLA